LLQHKQFKSLDTTARISFQQWEFQRRQTGEDTSSEGRSLKKVSAIGSMFHVLVVDHFFEFFVSS
jgi:hypothetical protein